jgi:hypothetical protein
MLACMKTHTMSGIEISFSTGLNLGSLVMMYNPESHGLFIHYFKSEIEGFEFISDIMWR